MLVNLIRENEVIKKVLPHKVSGQHVFTADINGKNRDVFAISAIEGKWVIRQTKYIELLDGTYNEKSGAVEIQIEPNDFYRIRYASTGETMIILVEPKEECRATFNIFEMPENGTVSIGYSKDNDICFHDSLLSDTVAAKIQCSADGSITVYDGINTNGTYLNSKRVPKGSFSKASYGDEIYLVGLRVIIGRGFIAVNNPSFAVTVNLNKRTSPLFVLRDDELPEESRVLFSSAPRHPLRVNKKTITIENPPKPSEEQSMPWAVVMGPSITMAFGSVFSSVFSITNIMSNSGDITGALPMLIMSLCMVVGTIVWPLFAKRFEKRSKTAKDKAAVRDYLQHLCAVEEEVNKEIAFQENVKHQNNPTVDECVSRVYGRKMTLWERSPRHEDFLDVMIGRGNIPMELDLKFPQRNAVEKLNEASKALYNFVDKPRVLTDVPITIPFRKAGIVGVIGERERTISAVKALLIQLTSLHNYIDLKLVFIYDKHESDIWSFVKWIPHIWNDEKSIRFIANDVDEAKNLSGYLSNIQSLYDNDNTEDYQKTHYVVVAADRILAEKIHSLKEFAKDPQRYSHITLLALYDERRYLPKSCSYIVDIHRNAASLSDLNSSTDIPIPILAPIEYNADPEDIFVTMGNIELDDFSSDRQLPTELTYLEMFQAGRPEHLDILSNWEDSDPVKSLSAPIGVDADGYMIKLDIHEKAHGPHGLIAGMTGSGKSEFIISYIASMAVNYSPEEVAFVLIDFKGGGMADVFKGLPHLAGSITNLDGNELQRSFIAIESELEKRQALFKEISEKKKISNIDIYKYQKLRRKDKSLKPLPHLIIISDEFAELKQQHGDFMQQLIRIARIGRSLGVHLILATQKPEGVVDEQIKSNIKFKICLKVQDKADSVSVIGRPDATMIVNPGRFYMQVGFNEVFEYGQSPWSGASYHPLDQFTPVNSKRVDVLNEQGRIIYRIKPAEPARSQGTPEKQIDALINYLSNIATEKGFISEKLWLDPLAGPMNKVASDSVDSYEAVPFVINPVVGLYDDLRKQRHIPLTVPLSASGNAIVYGASGSGKLSFLNQMILSLTERHTPDEVSVYAIDFDSGSLAAFSQAPHVQMVALSNEIDTIRQVFEIVSKELTDRKELFKCYGGDYNNYICSSGKTIPNIVLVIHNYLAFSEEYRAGEEQVSKIAREGKKYGIFVVLSAMDSKSVRYNMVPLFSNLYVLQQNNDDQYLSILGKTDGIRPGKFIGRGIFKRDNTTYEFQTTMPFEESDNIYEAISDYCRKLADASGYAKQELKRMPRIVDRQYFEDEGIEISPLRFPVAVSYDSKLPVFMDLYQHKLTFISYDAESVASSRAISEMICEKCNPSMVFDMNNRITMKNPFIISNEEAAEKAINDILDLINLRATEGQAAKAEGKSVPDFEHYLIFINDFSVLASTISSTSLNMLIAIIHAIDELYHINFVILNESSHYREISDYAMLGRVLPVSSGISIGPDLRGQKIFNNSIIFEKICEKDDGYVVINNVTQFGKVIVSKEGDYNG